MKNDNTFRNQVNEWSRHYDTLSWTVTGILCSANVGLLVYVWNNANPSWVFFPLGILLSSYSVFFAASFRSIRRRLFELPDEDDRKFAVGSHLLKQWPVFVWAFRTLIILWALASIIKRPFFWPIRFMGCIPAFLLIQRWKKQADELSEPKASN